MGDWQAGLPGSHPLECVIPDGVLIQVGPHDDEHLLLETCRGIEINTLKKSASSWSLTKIRRSSSKVLHNFRLYITEDTYRVHYKINRLIPLKNNRSSCSYHTKRIHSICDKTQSFLSLRQVENQIFIHQYAESSDNRCEVLPAVTVVLSLCHP